MTATAPASSDRTTPTEQDLLHRFRAVRALTERLAARLSAEDQVPQSMTQASPTAWHRAHTTWFFEEFVLAADPTYKPVDPTFRYLFNSYYEAVGDRQPRPWRGLITGRGRRDRPVPRDRPGARRGRSGDGPPRRRGARARGARLPP